MKTFFKKAAAALAVLTLLSTLSISLAPVADAAFVDVFEASCERGQNASELCDNTDTKLFGPDSFWTRIINTLLFVIMALGVVMITIGGFRYVTSGGDQSAVASAKNTILYSVIGIIVAIGAYAIVNFVLTSFI